MSAGERAPSPTLIEQRLEEVEVAPIDDGHLDRGMSESLGRGQAAKATAQDHERGGDRRRPATCRHDSEQRLAGRSC